MRILVTGGAGYIGSHVARLAAEHGHECFSLDNLLTGKSDRVAGTLLKHDLSLDSVERLVELLRAHDIEAVIHLAARKQVGESVSEPELYYRDNIGGLANLLLAMREAKVMRLIFSSSAASYGMPDVESVSESIDCRPINPYGETKLIGEWMVRNAGVWGLRAVSLRYFNVAGTGWNDLADTATLNLIPIAIDRLRSGKNPVVFGTDYPTPDGSCIRDYVHVHDLARAHLDAIGYLERERREAVFNVGTGHGASVIEVLEALRAASGIDFEIEFGDRRAGDPPRLVANVELIQREFDFKTRFDLDEIVRSAWQAGAE
jgi:UDP-glucose 4-epimerase